VPFSTRALLLAWARWGALQNLNYPHLSPMFGERALKTPLHDPAYAPPDVEEMEQAICRLDPDERRMLIHRYLWHMRLRQIAERWGISKSAAHRKVESAEWAAHVELSRSTN